MSLLLGVCTFIFCFSEEKYVYEHNLKTAPITSIKLAHNILTDLYAYVVFFKAIGLDVRKRQALFENIVSENLILCIPVVWNVYDMHAILLW